jgi:hypothetical protein
VDIDRNATIIIKLFALENSGKISMTSAHISTLRFAPTPIGGGCEHWLHVELLTKVGKWIVFVVKFVALILKLERE